MGFTPSSLSERAKERKLEREEQKFLADAEKRKKIELERKREEEQQVAFAEALVEDRKFFSKFGRLMLDAALEFNESVVFLKEDAPAAERLERAGFGIYNIKVLTETQLRGACPFTQYCVPEEKWPFGNASAQLRACRKLRERFDSSFSLRYSVGTAATNLIDLVDYGLPHCSEDSFPAGNRYGAFLASIRPFLSNQVVRKQIPALVEALEEFEEAFRHPSDEVEFIEFFWRPDEIPRHQLTETVDEAYKFFDAYFLQWLGSHTGRKFHEKIFNGLLDAHDEGRNHMEFTFPKEGKFLGYQPSGVSRLEAVRKVEGLLFAYEYETELRAYPDRA